MNETKLSSDEVPAKLADWLLAMGCPPDKVPTEDKISQMCRGTYYLVWHSLMEQIESKDIIKQKRLQVFANDVSRCKKKNLFTERDTNVLIPPELTLWRQQADVRSKVIKAEARVAEAKRNLHEIMDKVSSKMAQRNLARQRVQDLQRRVWLLQLVAEDLGAKKQSLVETRAIAEDVCRVSEQTEVQGKLDKCLQSMRRCSPQSGAAVASSTMIGHPSSSVIVADFDEEHMAQLVQCRGDALWAELYSRRAALAVRLSGQPETTPADRPTFQSVLTHTAALQCSLALEALKCREMARLAQTRLGRAVSELNSQLTHESCELLVVRCERARARARADGLRALLGDVAARAGAFRGAADRRAGPGARADVDRLDKAIESKKDDIKSVISSLSTTERKTQNVRECLAAVFNGFHKDVPVSDASSRGIQLDLPNDSIASLRQFHEQRRARRNKMELSLEFDNTADLSFDSFDISNARYVDELRIYLKKFNLEKNRKLVLESGEKIWIFETLQSSVRRLHSKWHSEDITCSMVCPSVSLVRNILRLTQDVALQRGLKTMARTAPELDVVVDMNKHRNEEDRIIDNVKKRLDENLRSLQKTSRTLDQGRENLCLWSDNKIKNQISHQRTVDGKPYKAYEAYYVESLNF